VGAVAVAVAKLLSLGPHQLAVDASRVEQVMKTFELLRLICVALIRLVDSVAALLFRRAIVVAALGTA